MSHFRISILILLAVPVFLFVGKLGWDEYQQRRAAAMLPEVVGMIDAILLPPETVQVNASEPASVGSANEYAASIWRYYKVEIPFSDLRTHIERQISQMGFTFYDESSSYGGPQFLYRKGEFEIRLCEITNPKGAYNVALSANWYGLER